MTRVAMGDVTINDQDSGSLPISPNPTRIVAQPSGAQTVSGNTGAINVGSFAELLLVFNITAVSGTTPSMTLGVDFSPDGGTTWVTGPSLAAQTAAAIVAMALGRGVSGSAGSVTSFAMPFGDTIRIRWTITGTTPSFTFAALAVGK